MQEWKDTIFVTIFNFPLFSFLLAPCLVGWVGGMESFMIDVSMSWFSIMTFV